MDEDREFVPVMRYYPGSFTFRIGEFEVPNTLVKIWFNQLFNIVRHHPLVLTEKEAEMFGMIEDVFTDSQEYAKLNSEDA